MSKPTDLNEYRRRIASEQQSPINYVDGEGRTWFKYAVEYRGFDGVLFGMEVWATDFNDAIDRVTCIGETGKVLGVIQEEIPL